MNKPVCSVIALLALFSLGTGNRLAADVKLPAVIDSHMVLQRDKPLPIWGWAEAGEAVTVTLDDQSVKTVADEQGKWRVTLSAVKADGKEHTLTVQGKNTIVLEDILIGDVWLGSGQSNMEWQLINTHGSKEAIALADHPTIRLFHVPKVQQAQPASDVDAKWKHCTPANIPTFSAVLYYFGLKLNQEVNVPIGLINSSWGGSPIEPWTIAEGKSGGMYNGMIAPLQPFAIRGAIWYQGETNALQKNGLAYYDKKQALISGWRSLWGQDLAFYFVQIAPWSGRYEEGELPALWEAQVASLKIPGTGMAVTTDLVDNIADIHPRNKIDVGHRLALWALAKSYGRSDLVYSGPLYKGMKIEGNQIRIEFAHATAALKSRDDKPLTEFQIAGADGNFVDATATLDGPTVLVSSAQVAAPKQVRFGWHKLANPNLVNSVGLPASPFQTNNWQGGTGE
ncbi:MAG: sialate O-acetylesterase [Planctomycetaceae bacterium]|nr:sialate O-acetylesterase [Planctomycetaceae bacterium]